MSRFSRERPPRPPRPPLQRPSREPPPREPAAGAPPPPRLPRMRLDDRRRRDRSPAIIAGVLVVLALAVVGVLGAIQLFDGDEDAGGSDTLGRGAAQPTATATASPQASPSPSPGQGQGSGAAGSPYSFSSLERAFRGQNINATLGEQSSGFTGMATTAYDLQLTRGSERIEAYLLVYRNAEAVNTDWQLSFGQAPELKSGRSVPQTVARWWNANVVLLIKTRSGAAISTDAFNAFLSLG
ncbi:MAG TPA: hypothetical protein VNL15_06960 [Dehalococcoidia bacterium]|nr:hypothetical protein [Dehalococcoidia bacterium]